MKSLFGYMPNGETVSLYTFELERIRVSFTDLGAGIVNLFVKDREGNFEDVLLGYDHAEDYLVDSAHCFGVTVGRSANRICNAEFELNGKKVQLSKNDNQNSLHSGPDMWFHRLWKVTELNSNTITFSLHSPDGDQGFPGNADVSVTYSMEDSGTIRMHYEGISDQDTVFNLTNHNYYNLCGERNTEKALQQVLQLPSVRFEPDDEFSIPTGERRLVEGTPMDFRIPKPVGRDIAQDYECLMLQNGYDHNYEVISNPCAVLWDPKSGRRLQISTTCPGVQVYSGNFIHAIGKNGCVYPARSGIALETQFAPDSVHHENWPSPVISANMKYESETILKFDAI